jgi:para-aminobenzoate synthetase component 1
VTDRRPLAYFEGQLATELCDVTSDLSALDAGGWWALVAPYDGSPVAARFARVRTASLPSGRWSGPAVTSWRSSMTRNDYVAAVGYLRQQIAAGTVYQANICRVLRADLPDPSRSDAVGLAQLLNVGNPAPYAGVVSLPGGCHPQVPPGGLEVVTASPELFLRRIGQVVESGPIKGTGRTAADLTVKDRAENVMIVDLVRNDLGAVCEPGSVTVPSLLELQTHPGLVHLVSTVRGRLRDGVGWSQLLAATFPPGSVTGAPKSSAIRLINQLEPGQRGPYCGAIGWASDAAATLAVGIRTFWREGSELCFGTGAGITWDSDPQREWDETELKAETLLSVAAGSWQADAL